MKPLTIVKTVLVTAVSMTTLAGCAVVAVADAAVSVVATTVKVGAAVVGTRGMTGMKGKFPHLIA